MKQDFRWIGLLVLVALVGCGGDPAQEEAVAEEMVDHATDVVETVVVDPAVLQMQADCAAAADAMAVRQTEASLYDRLGGRDAIFTVVTDVVARHRVNEPIMHLMEGVDDARLISQVTDFLSQASGGDVEYHGMNMVDAHAHMNLTDEHFLAAGGDVQAAMEAAGVGADEIQEMMCMFASLHGDVVRG
ncbi:MAG: group 1 truncated hemoglobin [Acidobacteriota bacterium]|nr:group 1 truncated hemoglobin [Acidobacteriota bacterium]